MAYKLVFHANSAVIDSLFYDYSAIVDSFVVASFLEKHYLPQYLR